MANSDASSAPLNKTVKVSVSFFLAATDKAPSARSTAAIQREKFNVPLSDEHKELYRFWKHLKTFPGLEEITRSKGLGEKPKSARSRSLEFKRQAVALKEPIYILHLLAFAEISLF